MCNSSFGRSKLGRGLVAKAQARKATLVAQSQQSAEPSAGSAVKVKRAPRSTLLAGKSEAVKQPTLLGG